MVQIILTFFHDEKKIGDCIKQVVQLKLNNNNVNIKIIRDKKESILEVEQIMVGYNSVSNENALNYRR